MCGDYLAPDQRPTFAPGDPPPFTGGQCPTSRYSLNFTLQVFNCSSGVNAGGPSSGTSNPLFGPVTIEGNGTNQVLFVGTDGNGNRAVQNLYGNNSGFCGRLSNTSLNVVSGVDDCGDLPSGPSGWDPAPNPFVEPPGGPDYDPGNGGPLINIDVGSPSVDIDGSINIPVTVDGVDINIGSPWNGPEPVDTNPDPGPDFDNPSGPSTPGSGGGSDGDDNPDDGLDEDRAVTVVVVTVVTDGNSLDREAGGPSLTYGDSERGSAGWFKWKYQGGLTEPQRLQNGVNVFTFGRGCCRNADGYQVKFSHDVTGSAVSYRCQTDEPVIFEM